MCVCVWGVIGVWPGLVARVPSLLLTTGWGPELPRGDFSCSANPLPGAARGLDISVHIFRAGRTNCQKGHLGGGGRGGAIRVEAELIRKILKHTQKMIFASG